MNAVTDEIIYEDCDGEPIAENTIQFRWIVLIMMNLDHLFRDRPDVFVAGDHLIYPVKGDNKTRRAPDAYVAFGRPKMDRGSYQVWNEAHIFPQVIFEVLSPSNRGEELNKKFDWYERYGAEEYYIYDPDDNTLKIYLRHGDELVEIPFHQRFTSPRLGITFVDQAPEIMVLNPDGSPFVDHLESMRGHHEAEQARREAELQQARADEAEEAALQERHRAQQAEEAALQERHRAQQAEEKAALLAAKLRELGIDPNQIN